jgi:ABC-type molybdate transport system substrate-binding protein
VKKPFILITVLALGALGYASYLYSFGEPRPVGRLVIFHADSLSAPFAAMEKEFEARYPHVDVVREAGGSTGMARLISEVGKTADIMVSADYTVIDKTLIPDHASFNIRFASNRPVTDESKFAEEINRDDLHEILYGVTLIDSAPNKPAAEAFLAYLLDADGGLKILQEMGQPPFVPARVPSEAMKRKLPASLQALVEVKE